MLKTVTIAVLTAALAVPAFAQEQKPAPAQEGKPTPAAQARAPEPPAQPTNIKIDVVISDQSAGREPLRKSVSMIVADRQNNSIRSQGTTRGSGHINLDARPVINAKDGKILISFGLDYQPAQPRSTGTEPAEPGFSSLTQRLALNVESGKAVVVSQAADPTSDRKVTVELTATILK
jgi:hypothetical protein